MATPAQLFQVIQSLQDRAKDAVWALTSCICKPYAKIKINGRTYNILKVLGEGGFSFVYLAQDEHSGRQFALKKIRCPTGSEGVKEAMREVEAYRRFKHPNIIRIMDSAVVQDSDGEGKIVYLFLPLYKRGNLQDAINSHSIDGSRFSEQDMMRLFRGTCEAVRAMHDFRAAPASSGPSKQNLSSKLSSSSRLTPNDSHQQAESATASEPLISNGGNRHFEDDEDSAFPQPEGDGEDGYSYHDSSRGIPLVTKRQVQDEGEVVFDGDEELTDHGLTNEESASEVVVVPYAHRDIKPGNVMISDEGAPILMDFGSTMKARIKIETRQQALTQQDIAAEQSTMAYRAPELFDVKTGNTLDEKVDIWSLGCTLFALAYNHSPFENTQTMDQGGSIAMAVMNAQYKHPSDASYSQGSRDLIDSMLKADPKQRPDIHEIIAKTDRVLQSLN